MWFPERFGSITVDTNPGSGDPRVRDFHGGNEGRMDVKELRKREKRLEGRLDEVFSLHVADSDCRCVGSAERIGP